MSPERGHHGVFFLSRSVALTLAFPLCRGPDRLRSSQLCRPDKWGMPVFFFLIQ